MSFYREPLSKTLPPDFKVEKIDRAELLRRMAHIKPITKENLQNGTGEIEKLDGLFEEDKDSSSFVIRFGKYKNQTVDEIYERDPNYFHWMVENNPVFAKIARQAGVP